MNDLRASSTPFDSFRNGTPEGFRYFFQLHHYQVYCFLLSLTKDREASAALTKNVFIVLCQEHALIQDEEHLLRRLYVGARVGWFLLRLGKRSPRDLRAELEFYPQDDVTIMDDPQVARNETLLLLQLVLQKLPPARRQVAELYFFQEVPAQAIAKQLGMEEKMVRAYLSDVLKRLGEGLGERGESKNECAVVKG